MKKIIVMLILTLFFLSAQAADKVAEQIVKSSDEQIQKVKKAAVEKLKARQAALQKTGDENAVEEIQSMIDDLEVQGNAKEKKITVTAVSKERGTKLGNFKKGDKITFQYVKGELTPSKEDLKPFSPDSTSAHGEAIELFSKPKSNVPDESIAKLPVGTAKTPFSYVFDGDVKNVALRFISGWAGWKTPDGEVVYKVTIEKQ